MKPNVGSIDRVVRLVLGLVLAGLVAFGGMKGVGAWVVGVLAVVMIATAMLRVCPLYRVFGMNTGAPVPRGRVT